MKRITLLAALAVTGLLLASCSSDSDAGSDPYGSSSDTADADTDTTDADVAAPVPADGDTLAVADIDGLGEALVDADGFTLYLFTNDEGTTSACADACLDTWPAAVANGEPVPGDGVDAALVSTADAAAPDQLVYNDHLLYRFSGDTAPGDANGAEIPNWHAVDVNGDAIEAA